MKDEEGTDGQKHRTAWLVALWKQIQQMKSNNATQEQQNTDNRQKITDLDSVATNIRWSLNAWMSTREEVKKLLRDEDVKVYTPK